jgi:formiminoglutamase
MVRANFHRYVIDPNRDPSGESLYPGQNTTGLCPLINFDNAPIYLAGKTPDSDEIERRRLTYHAAYHAALDAEIARVKAIHGIAILYDCHSIRSQAPFLFKGQLPDFNIGTNSGVSCAVDIENTVADICAQMTAYNYVKNGRFKGGWTTRHYGRPETGQHNASLWEATRWCSRHSNGTCTDELYARTPTMELHRAARRKAANRLKIHSQHSRKSHFRR